MAKYSVPFVDMCPTSFVCCRTLTLFRHKNDPHVHLVLEKIIYMSFLLSGQETYVVVKQDQTHLVLEKVIFLLQGVGVVLLPLQAVLQLFDDALPFPQLLQQS